MQFAGQRTGMDLQPLGDPHNFFIKLTEDVLPEPTAVLLTGITPQKTIAEGLTEAEFLKIFYSGAAIPETIFVGYNSIRFDDEFMRYLHYRNFYDAYEWQWQDGRSRWDLLDVVRMTRALRPEGILWPSGSTGKNSNRLELITDLNNINHSEAHDALSDVHATRGVAKLLRDRQPKLFEWLLRIRDKKQVAAFVHGMEMYLYTSGKYSNEYEKTAVVTTLAEHPEKQAVLVYDLRYDPTEFATLTAAELAAAWRRRKTELGPRLPIKVLQFNRCPAIAPLSVLDRDSQERLQIDMAVMEKHLKQLLALRDFTKRVLEATRLLGQQRQASLIMDDRLVDEQLYEGFFDNNDKAAMKALRATKPDEISSYNERFNDTRLKAMLPLYKARNYPKYLSSEEYELWESYRAKKLLSGGEESRVARYFSQIKDLQKKSELVPAQQYLLEELTLYGQSILPGQ